MTGRIFLASLFVSCLAFVHCQQSNKELDIPANGCSTFVLDSGSNSYSYNVTLGVADLKNCTNVTITKYFASNACLDSDGSGNELSIGQTVGNCPKANGNSSQTCTNAFAKVKSDRKLNVSSLAKGGVIDSGNSCDTEPDGFLYVQNSCATPVTIGIQFTHGQYGGLGCAKIGGHSINGVGIAVLVIGAVLLLVCLMAIIMCCCCR